MAPLFTTAQEVSAVRGDRHGSGTGRAMQVGVYKLDYDVIQLLAISICMQHACLLVARGFKLAFVVKTSRSTEGGLDQSFK